LVATRHILATEFRKVFYNKVDVLLDEKVFIGGGLTHQTLRFGLHSILFNIVY